MHADLKTDVSRVYRGARKVRFRRMFLAIFAFRKFRKACTTASRTAL
jgi:hypothetical protein